MRIKMDFMQRMSCLLLLSLLLKLGLSVSLLFTSLVHASVTDRSTTAPSISGQMGFNDHCGGHPDQSAQADSSPASKHGVSDCHECCTMGIMQESISKPLMPLQRVPAHKPIEWLNSAPQPHLRPPIL